MLRPTTTTTSGSTGSYPASSPPLLPQRQQFQYSHLPTNLQQHMAWYNAGMPSAPCFIGNSPWGPTMFAMMPPPPHSFQVPSSWPLFPSVAHVQSESPAYHLPSVATTAPAGEYVPTPHQLLKRVRITAVSRAATTREDEELDLPKKAKRNRKPRNLDKDNEPNGETRLDIKFTSYGTLPENAKHVQRWGKKGVIPNGLSGCFTFYGEDWSFTIKYHELRKCTDGVERYLLEFGIQHKSWSVSEVETEKQCRDRHQKGYTICNHVFALALDQRAKDYQHMISSERNKDFPNENHIKQCQARVDKLVPKRVSEGPLLFGLRHKCMMDEVKRMRSGEAPPTSEDNDSDE